MPVDVASFLPIAACAAAYLAAAVAVRAAWLVRGSTAVPAALWAVVACLALAVEMGARATGRLTDPAAAAAARLAVVSLSLCPAMSLLGAKRPQHGVWQLIVATLAVVLAMPAASAVLMRPGSLPDPHLIERCFMPLLVLVGWMNFAGTRRAAAAACVAIGQLLLLRGFLPGVAMDGGSDPALAGSLDAAAAGLVLVGMLWAVFSGLLVAAAKGSRRRGGRDGTGGPAAQAAPVAAAIDPVFLAMRETLGAAWTLRIAERFNTVAAGRGWPCRLGFGGLEHGRQMEETSASAGDDPAWQRDALRTFRSLARRFVSDAWLARHGWRAAES
jgi:hypothetical protein